MFAIYLSQTAVSVSGDGASWAYWFSQYLLGTSPTEATTTIKHKKLTVHIQSGTGAPRVRRKAWTGFCYAPSLGNITQIQPPGLPTGMAKLASQNQTSTAPTGNFCPRQSDRTNSACQSDSGVAGADARHRRANGRLLKSFRSWALTAIASLDNLHEDLSPALPGECESFVLRLFRPMQSKDLHTSSSRFLSPSSSSTRPFSRRHSCCTATCAASMAWYATSRRTSRSSSPLSASMFSP